MILTMANNPYFLPPDYYDEYDDDDEWDDFKMNLKTSTKMKSKVNFNLYVKLKKHKFRL